MDALIAEPFDIERVAAGEMAQPFDRLRRADKSALAAPDRHAFLAHRAAIRIRGNDRET